MVPDNQPPDLEEQQPEGVENEVVEEPVRRDNSHPQPAPANRRALRQNRARQQHDPENMPDVVQMPDVGESPTRRQ